MGMVLGRGWKNLGVPSPRTTSRCPAGAGGSAERLGQPERAQLCRHPEHTRESLAQPSLCMHACWVPMLGMPPVQLSYSYSSSAFSLRQRPRQCLAAPALCGGPQGRRGAAVQGGGARAAQARRGRPCRHRHRHRQRRLWCRGGLWPCFGAGRSGWRARRWGQVRSPASHAERSGRGGTRSDLSLALMPSSPTAAAAASPTPLPLPHPPRCCPLPPVVPPPPTPPPPPPHTHTHSHHTQVPPLPPAHQLLIHRL